MATLGFPRNPSTGTQYTVGARTWVWTGQGWKVDSGSTALNNLNVSQLNVTTSTNSTGTNSGGLIVSGGVGIGKALYVNTTSFIAGSEIITSATINTFATKTIITAGTDTAVNTSTGQVTIWNTSTLQSVTGRGARTNNAISITNATNSTASTNGALIVTGGVGVGGDLFVGGKIVAQELDIQYTTITTTIIQTDDIIQTYNTTNANSTNSGALQVSGGVGVGRDLYVGGNITVSSIFIPPSTTTNSLIYAPIAIFNENSSTSVSSGALTVLGGVGISKDLYVGGKLNVGGLQVLTSGDGNTGYVSRINAGDDISVSTNTGAVTVNDISTLQSVTNRGNSTTNNLYVTNNDNSTSSDTGALQVTGGVGVLRNIYAGATVSARDLNVRNNSTITGNLSVGSVVVNSSDDAYDSTSSGALRILGGVGVAGNVYAGGDMYARGYRVNTATFTGGVLINNTKILSTETSTSTNSGALQVVGGIGIGGDLYVGNSGSFNYITVRGSTTSTVTGALNVDTLLVKSSANSISTNTGALVVTGGAGIGGALYVNTTSFISGAEIITSATINKFASKTIITAGTDTVVNTSTGQVTIWNKSTLQTITDRGSSTNHAIIITDTSTGALQVVGGVGIGQDLNVVGTVTGSNLQVTGYDHVSTVSGYLDVGILKITAPPIDYFDASSTDTGAFQVLGGAGIGLNLWVGRNVHIAGTAYMNNAEILTTQSGFSSNLGISVVNQNLRVNTSTNAYSTNTGALQVLGGVGIGGNVWVGGDIYTRGQQVLTQSNVNQFANQTTIYAGTDTAVSSSTGVITIWNTSTLQTVTDRGNSTTNIVLITNTTTAINTYSGALQVAGGASVVKDMYVGGNLYQQGSQVVTFANTGSLLSSAAQYSSTAGFALSFNTNTLVSVAINATTSSFATTSGYALNFNTGTLVNISVYSSSSTYAVTAGTANALGSGIYTITNTTPSVGTNSGALQILGGVGVGGNLYVGGKIVAQELDIQLTTITTTLVVTDDIIQTYNTTNASSTNSGALQVAGGVGIGRDLYVGGALYQGGNQVITNVNVNQYANQTTIYAGTDTAVSSSTGVITIWNTSTLQSITSRGNTTDRTIRITNTLSSTSSFFNNALYVAGGIGGDGGFNINGDGYLHGNLSVSGYITGTNITLNVLSANSATFYGDASGSGALYAGVLGYTPFAQTMAQFSGNLNDYMEINVQNINSGANASTDIVASADNVNTQNAFIDMGITSSAWDGTQANSFGNALGPNDGYLLVGANTSPGLGDLVLGSTGQGTNVRIVVAGGNSNYVTAIFNTATTDAISTTTGALVVYGGIGIGGNAYVGGDIYTKGQKVITQSNVNQYANQTIIYAGTDTAVSANSGTSITIWNTSTLQTVTNRGNSTTNTILVANVTPATSTNSGALQVVGGVGIGGDVYIGGALYQSGQKVITTATVNQYANQTIIYAGTDTAVSSNSGTSIYIWSTGTLQTVTNRGNSTTNAILVANVTPATSTNSGALQVVGGVGIGGDLYVGGKITVGNDTLSSTTATFVNLNVTNTVNSTGTTTGALVVTGGAGIGGDLYVGGKITVGNDTLSSTTATFVNLNVTNTVNSTGTTTGALVVTGGVGIGGDLYVAGKIVAQELDIQLTTVTTNLIVTDDIISTYNTTDATSTSTGALRVTGGAGIGGNLYVGRGITATSVGVTGNVTIGGNLSVGGTFTATAVVIGGQAVGFGYSGSRGYDGSQGPIGYYGSASTVKGPTGPGGYAGSQGDTGSPGNPGPQGPQGYAGSRGFDGSRGATGFYGSTGYWGSRGCVGYTGSKGDDGQSVRIVGSTATASIANFNAVDPTPVLGDGVIVQSNGHLWTYTGATGGAAIAGFVDVGQLVGPTGNTGPQGPQGYWGSFGYAGSLGYSGSVGPTGPQGVTGPQGPGGYAGSKGNTGSPGCVGPQGPGGYAGSIGPSGPTGPMGYSGSQGSLTNTNSIFIISTLTNSTGTNSGALIVYGGVGIGKDLYVGGNIYNSSGQAIGSNSTGTTSTFTILNTTSSTSTNTGALQVRGGAGIGGDLYVGGNIYGNGGQALGSNSTGTTSTFTILNNTQSTSTLTGALVVRGGIGVGGDIYIVGNLIDVKSGLAYGIQTTGTTSTFVISNGTNSTSTVTGALVVQGGVGIGQDVTIGGSVQIGSTASVGSISGVSSIVAANITVTGNFTAPGLTFGTGTFITPVIITNKTASTSTNSGALIVSGGVGIAGDVNIGQTLTVGTTATSGSITGVSSINAQNIIVTGSLSAPNLNINNSGTFTTPITVSTTTNATSTATGALIVSGGAGFGGTVYANSFVTDGGLGTISGVAYITTLYLTATNAISITGTTSATSTATGALVVTGGAGVGGDLYIGGGIYGPTGQSIVASSTGTTSTFTIRNTTASTGTATGALQVYGGMGIGGNLYVGGQIFGPNGIPIASTGTTSTYAISNISNSTGTNTGALVVTGGVGIGGNLTVGGVINANNITTFPAGSNANLVIDPDGIGDLIISTATEVYIYSTLTSISTTTGALVVTGGVGVGGGIYVGGVSTFTNTVVHTGQTTLASLTATITTVTNLTVSGQSSLNGNLSVTGLSTATSTTTGALTVVGGAGVGGNLYVGNTLTVLSTLASTGSVSQNALYVAGGVGVGSSLYVTGAAVFQNSVTFNGTTTYVLSTNTVYTDNIIELHYPNNVGNAWTVNDNNDIGFRFHYYDTQDRNAFLGRDNTTGYLEWLVNSTPDNTSNVTGTNGTFRLGSIILTDTTATISTNTGALTVAGGVGLSGSIYVGNTATIFSAANATSTGSGALTVRGGVGIGGDLWISGQIYGSGGQPINATSTGTTSTFIISNNAASTSTNSGALQVIGGAGIGGNLNVGGNIVGGGVRSSSTSTAPSNPTVGDIWYNTITDDMYRYTSDGASSYWLDISGPVVTNITAYNATPLVYRLDTALTGNQTNSPQTVFGVGVTLAANTAYQFEAVVGLSKSAGVTTHITSILFGGTATLNNISYWLQANGIASTSFTDLTNNASYEYYVQTAAAFATNATQATAAAYRLWKIHGTVSVNASGTFIPQYQLSAAPGGAYTTAAGSYIRLTPIGAAGSNVVVGSWS